MSNSVESKPLIWHGVAMKTIGRVEILRRYPVKSMSGEDLDEVYVAFSGVAGDRVFAFVDDEKTAAGDNFPWHSAREQREMLLYKPRFRAPLPPKTRYPDISRFTVDVVTPSGATLAVDDPRLLAEMRAKNGGGVTLRFSEKGMQDARPLSLFSLDTLADLTSEAGVAIDHRQFRANFYVRWPDKPAYFEDELVGRRLKMGDTLEVMVVKKDPRCVIINMNPDTAEVQPKVLLTVAKGHKGCIGVYLAVFREGLVKNGAEIALLDD